MRLSEQPFVVIDVETTGLDPLFDQPVELAAVRMVGGCIEASFASLVDPIIAIPAQASGVHHITDADVKGQPTPAQARAAMLGLVREGDVIVAHNALFDRSFMRALERWSWLCTMRMAKHLWPHAPDFKNQTLRYFLNVALPRLDVQSHRSMPDVLATAGILASGLETYLAQGGPDDTKTLLEFVASPLRIERMPFGQHRGKLLAQVEIDYLQWALTGAEVVCKDADLRASIEGELGRRQVLARDPAEGGASRLAM